MHAAMTLAAAVLLLAGTAGAQSADEHVAMGDRDAAARNAAGALRHYEAALTSDPKHYDALCKASRTAIDLGYAERNEARRRELYRAGELHARRAVEANPAGAEGHYQLARALGRMAQSLGARDRVRYAGDVRAHALEALKLDPRHAGALHVMGVWNAEVMRLGGVSRFLAEKVLGGTVFKSASWEEAERYMEQAVQIEPDQITHRLDLAKIYADRGKKAKARQELEWIARASPTEFNDPAFKADAERLLRKL